jgi:hypothetical protein
MTATVPRELDDRGWDADHPERLRDSARHVIDIARRVVRAEIDAGIDPAEAMSRGSYMLECRQAGLYLIAVGPPDVYTREIETVLTLLHERLGGAESLWVWLRAPNSALRRGDTPLQAPVEHRARELARAAQAMAPKTEASPRTETLARPEEAAPADLPRGTSGSYSAVDAVLDDPAAKAEFLRRLASEMRDVGGSGDVVGTDETDEADAGPDAGED